MTEKPVDYYKILEISPTATQEQIRTAYKKAALKSHPDRVAANSPERPARTKKFQAINDAYYTLSDPTRRRDYDAARQWHSADSDDADFDEGIPRPQQSKTGGAFPWGAFGFGSKAAPGGASQEEFSNQQFGSAFEEMMRDAGLAEEQTENGEKATRGNGRMWAILGGVAGGTLGFIMGNMAGAVPGGIAGYKLGSVRDVHQKPVYQVFNQLDQGAKARLLSELAAKLFAQAVSG